MLVQLYKRLFKCIFEVALLVLPRGQQGFYEKLFTKIGDLWTTMTIENAEEGSLGHSFTDRLFEVATVQVKYGYLGILLIISPTFHVCADEAQ